MELADYLSLKSDADIRDIINQWQKSDIHKPYLASIIEFEEKVEIDWNWLVPIHMSICKKKIDVISVCLQESLTLIIPAYINNNALDIYPVKLKVDDISKYKNGWG